MEIIVSAKGRDCLKRTKIRILVRNSLPFLSLIVLQFKSRRLNGITSMLPVM